MSEYKPTLSLTELVNDLKACGVRTSPPKVKAMLCPEVLSYKSYMAKVKAMGVDIASANYQQEPIDLKGRLYSSFKTYTKLPVDEKGNSLFEGIYSYTDTADEGSDYLCSIIFGVYLKEAYVLDVYYTQAGMKITETETAKRFFEYKVNRARIERINKKRAPQLA